VKLGIGSYTFGWAIGAASSGYTFGMDENGLLDAARDLGIHLVQIGDNLPLTAYEDGRLEHLASRAATEGITLELGARGLKRGNLAANIAVARRLNARILRFVIDAKNYFPSPEQVIAMLREALPELTGGLTIAIENHDRFDALTLRRIIEGVGSVAVGVCLDTANSFGAGEGWREVATILAPYTVSLHIKDFAAERLPHQMGFTIMGAPAGEGLLDVPQLLDQLLPYERCHSAILELWTPPEPTTEHTIAKERAWAYRSIEYLRPFFLA